MGRNTGSGRAHALAVAGLCLAAAACQRPTVGDRAPAPAPGEGPRIVLEEVAVDADGRAVATFSVNEDGRPLVLDEVRALDPRFTLARLTAHPVDGLRAWKSLILNGSQTALSLPPSGPGTPAAQVLSNVKQPGSETPAAGTIADLGGGRFRYALATAPGASPDDTLRVGVWLRGAPSPSLRTSSTRDFRPSGAAVEDHEVVTDAACNGCHGNLVLHGTRAGVRLCLTCHTWQAADPDTIDPASTSTTAATDPNPLELGRLVHRIHRGRRLPTLYRSSSQAVPAPALAAGNELPLPFSPENATTPVVGRKYSIVGFRSAELVYGRVVQRAEGGLGPKTFAAGVVFPRDLRDCAACHGGAAQADRTSRSISRRTCAGCHPDAWFGSGPIADEVHLAHAGGPQADDARCGECHLAAPAGGKLYAPIELAHVPPAQGARNGRPAIEIVAVEGLRPGATPVVTYRLSDRVGPIVPAVKSPEPAWEPDSATSSYGPRRFTSLSIRLGGPTGDGYAVLGSGGAGSFDPLNGVTSAGADEYVYTFPTTVPAGAIGTWAVGMDGRRDKKVGHYDKAADEFLWPYTGETVRESPDNPVVYVDTATGTWSPAAPGAAAAPRRIVAETSCLRCHGRFELHGSQRHQLAYCLLCHVPTATDWAMRPKVGGTVSLAGTWDGIEERSVHLKVLVHRIHTGGRTGAASLEGIAPHVIYGFSRSPSTSPNPLFFDEGLFPNDLRNCTTCHEGKSYLVDAVPAGAPPTVANEGATVLRRASGAYLAPPPSTPPVQAACLGCHTAGATVEHARSKTTAGGVEGCAQCHARGALSVEVAHGLAPAGAVAASFSAIRDGLLVPRCASAACHAPGAVPPVLDAASAWSALVNAPSGQSSLPLVAPGSVERSYLVYKLRGDVASGGGSGAIMPTDGALAPADLAAVEAWIANGAPND